MWVAPCCFQALWARLCKRTSRDRQQRSPFSSMSLLCGVVHPLPRLLPCYGPRFQGWVSGVTSDSQLHPDCRLLGSIQNDLPSTHFKLHSTRGRVPCTYGCIELALDVHEERSSALLALSSLPSIVNAVSFINTFLSIRVQFMPMPSMICQLPTCKPSPSRGHVEKSKLKSVI